MDCKKWLYVFLLSIFVQVAFSDEDDEDDEGANDDIETFGQMFRMLKGGVKGVCKFRCPGDARPKHDPKYKPSSNGCGTFGVKFDVPHPRIEECCDHHDMCYDTCGNERNDCDGIFSECLNSFCVNKDDKNISSDKIKGAKCGEFVNAMQSTVAALGCPAYLESQRKACLCSGKTINSHQMNQILKRKEEHPDLHWKKVEDKDMPKEEL